MKYTTPILLTSIFILLQVHIYAQSSRLVAKASRVFNGTTYVLRDTTAYYYSNGKGGDVCHMRYCDSSNSWAPTAGGWFLLHHLDMVYDSAIASGRNNKLIEVRGTYHDSFMAGAPVYLKFIMDYRYDTQLQSVSFIGLNTGIWTNIWKDGYLYTGDGRNVNRIIHQIAMGSIWVGVLSRNFYYDSTAPNFYQQIDIDYNNGAFYVTSDFDYTVRSANNLTYSENKTWTGVDFSGCPMSTYVYTYDSSSHLLLTKTHSTETCSSGYIADTICQYSNFTSAGMPQTEIDQVWNGSSWVNQLRFAYKYNSFNQVTSLFLERWVSGAWATADLNNYYYEPYFPDALSKTENTTQMQVYPNPAQNVLHVTIEWPNPQPFTIAIFNSTGKQVYTQQVAALRIYNGSISTAQLPAGTYVLKLTGSTGEFTKTFIIAK